MLGYMEFLHEDWLSQILSWQAPSGCYGKMARQSDSIHLAGGVDYDYTDDLDEELQREEEQEEAWRQAHGMGHAQGGNAGLGQESEQSLTTNEIQAPGLNLANSKIQMPGPNLASNGIRAPGPNLASNGIQSPGLNLVNSRIQVPGANLASNGIQVAGSNLASNGIQSLERQVPQQIQDSNGNLHQVFGQIQNGNGVQNLGQVPGQIQKNNGIAQVEPGMIDRLIQPIAQSNMQGENAAVPVQQGVDKIGDRPLDIKDNLQGDTVVREQSMGRRSLLSMESFDSKVAHSHTAAEAMKRDVPSVRKGRRLLMERVLAGQYK